jgi:hypothetical protein
MKTIDTKQAFETIRKAATEHPDKEGVPIALAIVDIAEEYLSTLKRIADASERHLKLAESSV